MATIGERTFLGQLEARCIDSSRRGDGIHGIYLIEHDGKKFAVKCYGDKRSKWVQYLKSAENFFTGRSFESYRRRWKTERKVLKRWRSLGFSVFEEAKDFPYLAISRPYLAMKYVSGRTLFHYFMDRKVNRREKIEALRRFVSEWGKRHQAALKSGDRFLIQEHPTFNHVLQSDDGRLIFFDFEVTYRRGEIKELIAREIAGYMRSLFKITPCEELDDYFQALVEEYPHREFLRYPHLYFFQSPNPVKRFLHALNRRTPRNRRSHSRYNIARLLREYLETRS